MPERKLTINVFLSFWWEGAGLGGGGGVGGGGGGGRKSPQTDSLPCIKGRDNSSMKFIGLTSLNSRQNSIQLDWKLCEITGAESFVFSHPCDLKSRSRSLRPIFK